MKEINTLRQELSKRNEFLDDFLQEKKAEIDTAPPGALLVSSHGKNLQYYHRKTPKEKKGVYIRKRNQSLASELAQKNYNQMLIQSAKEEQNLLQNLENFYEHQSLEHIHESVPESHQPLITQITNPFDQFVENWLSQSYPKKEFYDHTPEFYSGKGERMRSKSEILIANQLTYNNIPYLYKKPLYLFKMGTIHPDFTLINPATRQEMYWEHMGLFDDREYREKAIAKINAYAYDNIIIGDRLILTFETAKHPLNMKILDKIIMTYWG